MKETRQAAEFYADLTDEEREAPFERVSDIGCGTLFGDCACPVFCALFADCACSVFCALFADCACPVFCVCFEACGSGCFFMYF